MKKISFVSWLFICGMVGGGVSTIAMAWVKSSTGVISGGVLMIACMILLWLNDERERSANRDYTHFGGKE